MLKIFSSLLLFLLFGCAIEDAKPEKTKHLTLAQNFMSSAQKRTLYQLAKRKALHLHIIELSADSIRQVLAQHPWNPGFDLVMLDGLSAQNQVKKLPFHSYDTEFGVIPIGISYVPDSLVKVRSFTDLSNLYLWAAADEQAFPILKAHLAYAYRKSDQDEQIKVAKRKLLQGFKDHQLALVDNYQRLHSLYLCRYDTHIQQLKTVVQKRQFTYARKSKQLFFADYLGLGVVQQSPQLFNALQFVHVLERNREHNPHFRKAFGLILPKKANKQVNATVLLTYLEK